MARPRRGTRRSSIRARTSSGTSADAQRLLDSGTAYRCFCTPAELDGAPQAEAESRKESVQVRPPLRSASARRGRAPRGRRRCRSRSASASPRARRRGTISCTATSRSRTRTSRTSSSCAPTARRSTTSPSCRDDIAMRITLVMRGDDHISNTPKQILLYQALGATLPQFAHLPMIHGIDGKKLSKRHGATAVGDYQHLGILPEAMLNFLALLGWSPGNDIEVMTLPEMIELFSTWTGCSKKAAIFDPQEARVDERPAPEPAPVGRARCARGRQRMEAAGLATAAELEARRDWFVSLLDLLKVRARTIDDIVRQAAPYLPRGHRLRPGRRRQAVEGPRGHRRDSRSRRARRSPGWSAGSPRRWKRRCACWPRSGFGDRREGVPTACVSLSRGWPRARESSTSCSCWAATERSHESMMRSRYLRAPAA